METLLFSFKKWVATSSQKQKATTVLSVLGLLSTLGLMLMKGASGAIDDPLQSSPFYFIGVFAKLGVVLLLILACSGIFRRWLQPHRSGRKIRQLQVIETVRLSPKQALHLVSIGDRQLLIGATDQNVSMITPVELILESVETESARPAASTDFEALLQAVNFHSPAGSSSKA